MLFAIVVAVLAPAQISHAQTISASHDIKIQAVVAPAQYIIVNSDGQIVEIGSNSAQAATPQVYKGRVALDNQIRLTPELYSIYSSLVKNDLHAGVLYRSQPLALANKSIQLKALNLLSI